MVYAYIVGECAEKIMKDLKRKMRSFAGFRRALKGMEYGHTRAGRIIGRRV